VITQSRWLWPANVNDEGNYAVAEAGFSGMPEKGCEMKLRVITLVIGGEKAAEVRSRRCIKATASVNGRMTRIEVSETPYSLPGGEHTAARRL